MDVVERDVMTVHSDHESNGESSIPMWVYLTGIGLFIFTILCFGILVLGMVYI